MSGAHPTPKTLVGQVLELSKKAGAQHAACALTKSRSNTVVYRDGTWEELKGATTFTLTVRLFVDGRYGVHVTSDPSHKALAEFLKEAVALTCYLAQDPHRHLPERALYGTRPRMALQLFDKGIEKLTLEKRKALAVASHEAARATAGRECVSCASTFGDSLSTHALGTTKGMYEEEVKTSCYHHTSVSLRDPNGGRPSDYRLTAARSLGQLESPKVLGEGASRRARSRLGARKIASGSMDIVVENRALGSFLRGLLSPLYGSNVYNKQSCLAPLMGHAIAPKGFSLISDPLVVGGLGSSLFDAEGIYAAPLSLIKEGQVNALFLDTYYASKLNQKVTCGERFNLRIPPGNQDLKGLLSGIKKGLLITDFNGGNANSTTGDFSHGIKGQLVEGGKCTTPVKELNLSGNHTTFWKKIDAVGRDLYLPSSTQVPSLRFRGVTVAGK